MRTLTVTSGVILTLAGIFSIASSGRTFSAVAFVLGISMMFSGVTDILTYLVNHKRLAESGWQLAEGIITTVLSCVVLANQVVSDSMVTVFFGMWLLFCGTCRILASFVLKEVGVETWSYGLLGGILSLVASVSVYIHAVTSAVSLLTLIGSFFLIQGINHILAGMHMKKSKRKKKKELTGESKKQNS